MGALLAIGATQGCVAQGAEEHQQTFETAQKATHALYLAIKSDDMTALTAILGAPKKVICSDDQIVDKSERAQFVQKYQEMRRLVKEPNGTTVLYIGAENWPFPFPLMSTNGVWRFDTAVGTREIMYRRIGENETAAIQECRALHSAAKPIPGQSPIEDRGYYFKNLMPGTSHNKTVLYNGKPTDKIAFIAYPSVYRSSGVMTFVVRQDGAVYAKDLGPDTGKPAELARIRQAWSEGRPDATWVVEK